MLAQLHPRPVAPLILIAPIALAAVLVASASPTLAAGTGDELRRVQGEFQERADKARKEYRKALVKHARVAVGKYEKLAAESVRGGDLATATTAMRAILELDRNHKKAVAHFKAIGQLDEVLKELAEEPGIDFDDAGGGGSGSSLARKLVGTTWSWSQSTIVFSPGGTATVSSDAKPNTRRWRVDSDGYLHVVSTQPEKNYAVVQFDSSVSKYSGKSYHLSSPNHAGKRIR